ncbi:hypothetical protein MBLNU230_g0372t1 [Neophaeotheca triangularis]
MFSTGVITPLLLLLSSSAAALEQRSNHSDELLNVEQPVVVKLRPQQTTTRELLNLDGLWKFALVPEAGNSTYDMQSWAAPMSTDLECPVPASYNDIFLDPAIHNHVGWVRYQRNVIVPRGWSRNDRFVLRAESATHRGRMYVNDRAVADHQGGYTPFEADVTDLVTAGEEFRLTIAVNNELTDHTIPPGVISRDEYTGVLKQDYYHDFYNYAGLARSILLYTVPQEHIQDVTVTTDVDGETGIINYDIQTAQGGEGQVNVRVLDEDGTIVANASGAQGSVRIDSVNLWEPGAAYLYQFQVNIVAGDGSVIDTYSVATGIRTIEVQGLEFLVNGKPFYFRGFGTHEDAAVRGKGHDQPFMVHDFQLLNWIGANSFRTSHYPYAEDIYEYADRKGIVIIDETPAVGLNIALNAGSPEEAGLTFRPGAIDNVTQQAHAQSISEMISRDKNHASIVMWSIANEPASQEDGARPYFEPLAALTRKLDPTRPITFANVGVADYKADQISDLFDVTCINRYFGWYEETGDLAAAEVALKDSLQGWEARFPRPMIMTEYGADTIAGLHAAREGVIFSEEFQTEMLDLYHRVFDRTASMSGELVWAFADFQTKVGTTRVDGNKKGIFTRERRPKSAAQLLRRRWTPTDNYGQSGNATS